MAQTVKLVDFHAPWCGPCRAMEPVIDELRKEMGDKLVIERINVDEEPDKSNAAGVMSIPTLHIVKDNKIVQTLIGYQSREELQKHLNAALQD